MDSDFILKEEAEVYDRQLRLWGLPAQKKFALYSFFEIGC
jgi:molybdopterin/thiamine biosynthesis adenylyltransferase